MNVNSDLISVIVPIHDVGAYLGTCIDSLLMQTHQNLEIILVDNGSTDNCPQICDSYAKIDKRVKVIHQPNLGLVGARKTGLAASSGNYIACLDGDDWVEPEMYDELYKSMTDSNADIVIGGHKENLLGKTELMYNTIPTGVYSGVGLKKIYENMLCNGKFSQFGIYSYHWNKLFKRNIIYNNQMNVDNRIFIGEDAACVYPSLLDASIICVTDICRHHYRQSVNSMVKTTKNYMQEYECISVLYNYLKDIFSKSVYSDSLLQQLDMYIISLITVRSDCLLPKEISTSSLFPFTGVNSGSSIILFGAGTFGQHLYRRLMSNDNFNCVLWVDLNYEQYQKFNLPVQSIDKILETDYDFILIAYIDETVALDAKNLLLSKNISQDKIMWIDYDLNDTGKILKIFGF